MEYKEFLAGKIESLRIEISIDSSSIEERTRDVAINNARIQELKNRIELQERLRTLLIEELKRQEDCNAII